MTLAKHSSLARLIVGMTDDGKTFRPGDWAERLAGVITLFVRERRPDAVVASTWLAMPCVVGGVRCLRVSAALIEVCPDAFDFVMRFAEENGLLVESGGTHDGKHDGKPD
jgi:hypothetical protein